MSSVKEYDDETALFMREMAEEEPRLQKLLAHRHIHRIINDETYEVLINRLTLSRLVQRHNEAVALLREFLAVRPEANDLTRRARRFVDSSK